MQPLKWFGVPALVGLLMSFAGTGAADGQADIARGEQLYMQVCAACHGRRGKGVPGSGEPFGNDLTPKTVVRTALEGGERMPPFEGTYSEAELKDVAAYITKRLLAD